ncbi:hypothetical protein BJ170DRAFT_637491 [Xylariales sp. AK1849]|nr:hypothetical protein BJ170DRAFT_637491 [Xylariales sp. AK1849]
MKFFILSVVTALAYTAMAQGPCYNQADPDQGIGNYCYCEGNGLCYYNDPDTGCNPTSGRVVTCP